MITNKIIYFDNAATTFPKPSVVSDEVYRCMTEYGGNPGRSSHVLSSAAAEKVYECRELIAEMFGSASPENVVFTYNATYAINMALKGVLHPGDHVLISSIEHNSVIRPVHAMRENGVEYSVFNVSLNEERLIKNIEAAILPTTKVIIVSHSSNICGITLPLRRIGSLCRAHDIIFIVDASQSAGTRDINVTREFIDILCAPGHKGLYGPQGSGFMLVSENSKLKVPIMTLIEGGNGTNSLFPEMPDFLPERLEAGTLGTPAIAGLCEGIKFVKSIGTREIFEHECRIYRRIRNNLKNIRGVLLYADNINESSVLIFNMRNKSSSEVSSRLDEIGICTRSGLHCSPLTHKMLETGEDGAVRISIGYFNTTDEADELCNAVALIANG